MIGRIRSYLNKKNAEQLVNSLVTSILDYANAILCGLPDSTINQLRKIQNWAAKLVLRRSKYDSSTENLKLLHWLPVRHRVNFKVCCLVHKCTYSADCPGYIKELVSLRTTTRQLRSSKTIMYTVPKVQRPTYKGRAFSFMGPHLWNYLPSDIQSTEELSVFKKNLKTH
eukprot:GHVU01089258.1.p1 GENE.GHVU01089258.1~~GHVU01089258.1.p1  ORF type:complete len:169 (-),score=6.05 GHVU01089258.1:392-898(-)